MKSPMHGVICVTISMLCVQLFAMEKQKVLVTGGAGYVGSHIAWVLAKNGYEVIVLDHNVKKRHPWAHYIEADYADEKILSEIFTKNKIECVFHCAAYAIVPESFAKALEFYENNIAKTIHLLTVMRSHNVNRIIFAVKSISIW